MGPSYVLLCRALVLLRAQVLRHKASRPVVVGIALNDNVYILHSFLSNFDHVHTEIAGVEFRVRVRV